ncbi:hypothetical protein BJV82DRAFT_376313 [Fennellomyces sp. T-0311]|nr:hypothetical protein BJV82DRAFT_376313 [Fennellomyces sp. T-0311]
MSSDKPVLKPLETDHVKFESLMYNSPPIPISTTEFCKNEYPSGVSLVTSSDKYGFIVVGTTDGFILGETYRVRQHLRTTKKAGTKKLQDIIQVKQKKPVRQLRLSSDQLHVIVCLSGATVVVYHVNEIVEKKDQVQPRWSFSMNHEILDFQPSPAMASDLATVLCKRNGDEGYACSIVNWKTGFIKSNIAYNNVTATSWSPAGDQFVCGLSDGSLHCYSAVGLKAREVPFTSTSETKYQVRHVIWLDKSTFFVIYVLGSIEGNEARIVHLSSTPGEASSYTLLADVEPQSNHQGHFERVEHYKNQQFYTHVVRNFGQKVKNAIIVASNTSSQLTVVGQDDTQGWATWNVPGSIHHTLPDPSQTVQHPYPVGFVVDCSQTPSFGQSYDQHVPVLYYVTNIGMLTAYQVTKGYQSFQMYDGMVPVLLPLSAIPPPGRSRSSFGSPFSDSLKQAPGKAMPSFRSLEINPYARFPYSVPKRQPPRFGETSNLQGSSLGYGDFSRELSLRSSVEKGAKDERTEQWLSQGVAALAIKQHPSQDLGFSPTHSLTESSQASKHDSKPGRLEEKAGVEKSSAEKTSVLSPSSSISCNTEYFAQLSNNAAGGTSDTPTRPSAEGREQIMNALAAANQTYKKLLDDMEAVFERSSTEQSSYAKTKRSGWLSKLGQSIQELKTEIAEKESDLEEMKKYLLQMERLYLQGTHAEQDVYEDAAQHLRREVFRDSLVEGTKGKQ